MMEFGAVELMVRPRLGTLMIRKWCFTITTSSSADVTLEAGSSLEWPSGRISGNDLAETQNDDIPASAHL